MAHIFSDCFAIYNKYELAAEMAASYIGNFAVSYTGDGAARSIVARSALPSKWPGLAFEPVRDLAFVAEFELGSTSGGSNASLIAVCSRDHFQDLVDAGANTRMVLSGINLSCDAGNLYVTQSIRRDDGADFANNLILAEAVLSMTTAVRYSIEMRVNLNGVASNVTVLLDGVEVINVTFDEAWSANGYEMTEMSCIPLGLGHVSNISYACSWYNIFVYQPDAEHVFPLGPLEFELVQFENRPYLDTNYLNYIAGYDFGTDFEELTLADGAIAGEIVHSALEIRLEANGVQFAMADMKVATPGKADVAYQGGAVPGLGTSIARFPVTIDTDTELTGSTMSIRTAPAA